MITTCRNAAFLGMIAVVIVLDTAPAAAEEPQRARRVTPRSEPHRKQGDSAPKVEFEEGHYGAILAVSYLVPNVVVLAGLPMLVRDTGVVFGAGVAGMVLAPPLVHFANDNDGGAGRAVLGIVASTAVGFGAGYALGTVVEPDCDDLCRYYQLAYGVIGGLALDTIWGIVDSSVFAHTERTKPASHFDPTQPPKHPRHGKPITWQPSLSPVLHPSGQRGSQQLAGVTLGVQGQF
jgi:hypothetical protein